MDIHAEKIELTKLLLNTNDITIIKAIRSLFKKEVSTDFWDELSVEEQAEINKASKEIEEGKTIDYEKFMEKHRV